MHTTPIDTMAETPFTDVFSIYNEPTDPVTSRDRSVYSADCPRRRRCDGQAGRSGLELPARAHPNQAVASRWRTRPTRHPRQRRRQPGRRFALHAIGVAAPDDAAPLTEYADDLIRQLSPWSTGRRNVNYRSAADANPERVQEAYDRDAYRHLTT